MNSGCSIGVAAGARATRLRDTLFAKKFLTNFNHIEAAAFLAAFFFRNGRAHFAKLSAIAIALRMAMDLLTVS